MFWERLYNMCLQKGCKPNTIAKAIGLSTATATKWKNGAIPNGEALAKIADYLDCSVDYLLGRTDNPEVNRTPEKEYLQLVGRGGTKFVEVDKEEVIKALKEENKNKHEIPDDMF